MTATIYNGYGNCITLAPLQRGIRRRRRRRRHLTIANFNFSLEVRRTQLYRRHSVTTYISIFRKRYIYKKSILRSHSEMMNIHPSTPIPFKNQKYIYSRERTCFYLLWHFSQRRAIQCKLSLVVAGGCPKSSLKYIPNINYYANINPQQTKLTKLGVFLYS